MYSLNTTRSILKLLTRQNCTAVNSCQQFPNPIKHKFHLSKPTLNEKFLLDKKNKDGIDDNVRLRKGVGNIHLVHEIKDKLSKLNQSDSAFAALNQQLQDELRKIPNDTHPDVRSYGSEPKVVATYNEAPKFEHKPLEFSEIGRGLNILRTGHLGNYSGNRSFFLMSDLAELVSELAACMAEP